MKSYIFLSLLLGVLLLSISGCIAEKEAPPIKTTAPPAQLSEPELSSQVEEVIGISEQATMPSKTGEIIVPDFEVNVTIDLGSVI
ncbi:MAG: hypothetical protein HY930_02745 [Euryarchaeota archaeon]|nr:hypothetical protein [Euryarchaeota archaeon]